MFVFHSKVHETDSKHKKRRVSAIASDYQAGGEFADDWEAWGLIVACQCTYVRLLTFLHAHLFTFTKLAIHVSQAYRDAVIMVYTDKGEAARCGLKDIETARKEVTMATYEKDERSKQGTEDEKSRFLEGFKDQPETFKKARWNLVRFRNPKTGRWVIEQRTKVYDQVEVKYRFKESTGTELRESNVLDNG